MTTDKSLLSRCLIEYAYGLAKRSFRTPNELIGWLLARRHEGFPEHVLLRADPFHPMWQAPRAWIKGYPLTHIENMSSFIMEQSKEPKC